MDYDEFLETLAYDKIVDLSASTVALSLSAITLIQLRENWSSNGDPLTDAQWDNIRSMIAIGQLELMSALVGMIMPSVLSTVSVFKFLPCDGQAYNKSDYPLLYEAIDPVYIVSGTQFITPDLRDRVIVGTGSQYALNDSGGADSVALSVAELAPHSHTYNKPTAIPSLEGLGVPNPLSIMLPELPAQTTPTGSGTAHENRQPYRAINWVIVAG